MFGNSENLEKLPNAVLLAVLIFTRQDGKIGQGAIDVVAGLHSDATCPDRARSADLRAPDLVPRLFGSRACQPDD